MFSNKNQNVLQEAKKIQDEFIKNDISCIIDDGNESFGFKINNSEVLGTPFFIAIGPKDIEKKQCILIRRDNNIKHTIQLDNLVDEINKQAIEYDKLMYEKSYNNLKNSIVYCENMDECIKAINENKIIIAPFGASAEEEEIFKQKTNAKPRCIVSEENFDLVNHLINEMIPKNKKCVITGKDAFAYVYFGRQY
jgi:prolyl-tRNA synthetase